MAVEFPGDRWEAELYEVEERRTGIITVAQLSYNFGRTIKQKIYIVVISIPPL